MHYYSAPRTFKRDFRLHFRAYHPWHFPDSLSSDLIFTDLDFRMLPLLLACLEKNMVAKQFELVRPSHIHIFDYLLVNTAITLICTAQDSTQRDIWQAWCM